MLSSYINLVQEGILISLLAIRYTMDVTAGSFDYYSNDAISISSYRTETNYLLGTSLVHVSVREVIKAELACKVGSGKLVYQRRCTRAAGGLMCQSDRYRPMAPIGQPLRFVVTNGFMKSDGP